MVRTVSDKGSFYGWTGELKLNRLLGQQETPESLTGNIKIKSLKVAKWIQQNLFALPIPQIEFLPLSFPDLCNRIALIAKIVVIYSLWQWLFRGVEASCPAPGITRYHGFVVPVIPPCNFVVKLNGRGIDYLLLERNLSELRHLEVSNNHIENVQTGSFLEMRKLEEVHLSHNDLSVIRSSNFNGSSIERLFMDNNQITFFYEGALDGVNETIQILNISFNHLKSLGKGMINSHGLKVLDISFNDVSVVDQDAFKGMDGLLKLFLQGNKLVKVSGWLPNVRHHLNLSANEISTTEGLPQNENLELILIDNPLNCSQENRNFITFCLQTTTCYVPSDLEGTCDVSSDPNPTNLVKYNKSSSEGESDDPKADNGGKNQGGISMLILGLSMLVVYYNTF